jgi:HlyD family secretion protein
MIESDQPSGETLISSRSFRPDHPGARAGGPEVSAGTPLFTIDDSVQRATTEQLRLQSEAALALLNELKRSQDLKAVAKAQVDLAEPI